MRLRPNSSASPPPVTRNGRRGCWTAPARLVARTDRAKLPAGRFCAIVTRISASDPDSCPKNIRERSCAEASQNANCWKTREKKLGFSRYERGGEVC
jgi:hypothetical protein